MAIVPPLIVTLLVLLWGGFFNLATCAVGVLLCALAGILWLRKERKTQTIALASLLPLAIALAYAASAVANGVTLTTVSETAAWITAAGFSLLVLTLDAREYQKALEALCWVGVATAVGGILVYVGVIPLSLGMVDERLQFTFQYANAAAAWYAACTFFALFSPNAWQRSMAFVVATAFLLTMSGGGTLVYLLVALALGVAWGCKGQWGRLLYVLVHGALAVAFFVVLHAGQGNQAFLLALVLMGGVCFVLHRQEELVLRHDKARTLCLVTAGALGAACVAAPLLVPARLTEALATFVERFYQMHDGLALWTSSPLLGIGPDNWQYHYAYVQTAQYHSTVVHSSYVQVLCDAGLLGLLLLVAFVVLGVRSIMSSDDEGWKLGRITASLVIALHAFIDFDLQFSSIMLLLVLLVGNPLQKMQGPTVKGLVTGVLSIALMAPLCAFGAICDATRTSLVAANAGGDYQTCRQIFENNSLALGDPTAQEEYLAALYEQGALSECVSLYRQLECPTDKATLYAALACYGRQDYAIGGAELIQHMEAQPYNDEFYRNVKVLIDAYGLDASLVARYNAAVDRANMLASKVSPLLPKQQQLETRV